MRPDKERTCMFTCRAPSPSFVVSISLLALAIGCGSNGKSDSSAGVTVVPRPEVDAGARVKIPYCEPEETCQAAQSCEGTCGAHYLGDRSCTCKDGNLACTDCTLNAAFKGMVQDATELCKPGTGGYGGEFDPENWSCTQAGKTCIVTDPDVFGPEEFRLGCLCWMGKKGLQWDCSEVVQGVFQDKAPPGPPRDGGIRPEPGDGG
jgi:hypothetical protein